MLLHRRETEDRTGWEGEFVFTLFTLHSLNFVLCIKIVTLYHVLCIIISKNVKSNTAVHIVSIILCACLMFPLEENPRNVIAETKVFQKNVKPLDTCGLAVIQRGCVDVSSHPWGVTRRLCQHWDFKQLLTIWKVKVATRCCFHLHFFDCHSSSTISAMLFGHFCFFFWERAYKFFCLFFYFVLWFLRVPLSCIRHEILALFRMLEIISVCFKHLLLLIVVLDKQKLCVFRKSNLTIFS